MNSPTQHSLDYFRERGWEVGIVERYVGPLQIRIDFCGYADLIAYNEQGTLAIQCCTTGDLQKHVRKILGEPQGPSERELALAERCRNAAFRWLMHESRGILLLGWKKYKKPVEGKYVRPTIHELTINDFI